MYCVCLLNADDQVGLGIYCSHLCHGKSAYWVVQLEARLTMYMVMVLEGSVGKLALALAWMWVRRAIVPESWAGFIRFATRGKQSETN